MSIHTVVLFLHILFAVVWLGGNIHSEALQRFVEREGTRAKIVDNYAQAGRVNRHLFLIPSWGIIATGAWLVVESAYRWGELWITTGLGLTIFAAAFGALILTPRGRAVSRMLGHMMQPEASAAVAKMRKLRIMHTVVLVIVLTLMVFKPSL